jgi:hypothetical protein
VYDSWRILDRARITASGVQYASLGYEPDTIEPAVAAVIP